MRAKGGRALPGPADVCCLTIDPTIAAETALERYRSHLGLAVALPGLFQARKSSGAYSHETR
jgi:hypothetical protein